MKQQSAFEIQLAILTTFVLCGDYSLVSGESSHSVVVTEDRLQRCAAYSLAACLETIGIDSLSVRDIEIGCGQKAEKTSLQDCADFARKLGLCTDALRWRESVPTSILRETPAILPIVSKNGHRHFVAAVGSRPNQLLIIDYPFPITWVSSDILRKEWHWDGMMLHIARDDVAISRVRKLSLRRRLSPWPSILGLGFVILGISTLVIRRHSPRISRSRPRIEPPCAGFTVIELLVAMGVISLLIALILPAIQSARESARKLTCRNNLHQIGIALEAFQSSHGRFPSGAISSVNSQGQPLSNNVSPQVELLPYLDQQALYDLFDRSETGSGVNNDPATSSLNGALILREVAVFACPSDGIGGARCNYRISAGTSPWMHETLPKSPTAALQGYRSLFGRRDGDFLDGKTYTAAFAEKLVGDRDSKRYTPWRDAVSVKAISPGLLTPSDALNACVRPVNPNPKHFSFGGSTWVLSGYPQTWYNHVLTPNSEIPDCVDGGPMGHGAFTARSLHSGGVNVLFADGSVRFAGNNIDLSVWRAQGTVNGNEPLAQE